jgi:hypothetical protein
MWSQMTRRLHLDWAPHLFLFHLGCSEGGCDAFHAAQEATEVEAELRWV